MSAGAVVLLLSLAGNAVLGWAYLEQRDQAAAAQAKAAASLATATTQRDQARADATACSDATEALRELADRRTAAAAPARAAAASTARMHQARADATLSLQPSKPADLCASMQAMGDEWLQGRAKP
ncbi:hypothetical protein [Acidovorax sp.]|uniref:hypothetical protein n=1 Tax=Acidovorax sp. TaxID=1872122 RepID=UPI00391F29E1